MFSFIKEYFYKNITSQEKVIALMHSLNQIDNVNRGGCLFAAYGVYLKTQKLGIKGISLIQIDYGDGYIQQNRAFLKGEIDSPISGNHYALKVDKKIIDSTGICYIPSEYKVFNITSHSDINKLCTVSLQKCGWNHDFDRYYGVARIKEILGIDLSYCL